VIAVQLVLVFQGLDVCDDGFAATFYQQFFKAPASIEYNFVYWLSGLVGAVWYHLFPDGGIFWLRILAIIVNTGTFYLSFRLLIPYIKPAVLLVSLVITLFINDYGFLLFYNNHLTAFLVVLSMLLMHRGLLRQQLIWTFISGVVVGLNVFSRIPNLTQLALILVIPFWFGFKDGGFKKMMPHLIRFKLGVVSGFGIIAIAMLSVEHLGIFKEAFLSLFDLGKTADNAHNLGYMLGVYFYNYKQVVKYGLFLLFFLYLFMRYRTPLISKKFRWLAAILCAVGVFQWLRITGIYGYYALGYAGIALGLLFKDKNLRLLCFMALISQAMLPLGSSGGMNNIGYVALWLSIPLFFHLIDKLAGQSQAAWISPFKNLNFNKTVSMRGILWLVMIPFLLLKSYRLINAAYFDPGSRFDKRFRVKSDKAQWIYTTQSRASVLNEVLEALQDYVEADDYVFIFDKSPMLHFLTETRPYLYNSWPWIYDEVTFRKKLQKAEQELELPVVVIQKFETIGAFSLPKEDYMSTHLENNYFHTNAVTAQMNAFLQTHQYQMDWSNSYYEIYIPKKP
jgi:hypothetical protein